MAKAPLRDLSDDEVWARWRDDLARIRQDAHELFRARRTFRDVVEVFKGNPRLQDTGGHLWQWMLVNYASFVVMRIRREVDDQGNVVSLDMLLREIAERPGVIMRQRYIGMLALRSDSFLIELNHRYFSETWANPAVPDVIDADRVKADRDALQAATDRVQAVGNRSVAHRQRVEVKELKVAEADAAFDALEATLTKYWTLLHGSSLDGLEPAPQFDTHEVYTFPWLER